MALLLLRLFHVAPFSNRLDAAGRASIKPNPGRRNNPEKSSIATKKPPRNPRCFGAFLDALANSMPATGGGC